MNLHTLLLTENDCYKAGRYITPKGIVVHSTGANNPYLKRYVGPDDGLLGENEYRNHWNQHMTRKVCAHAFIGRLANGAIATYQTLPWDMRGWHAGGSANNTHIGFEICEDDLTDAKYFSAVYTEAVELCAHLCRLYGLDSLGDGVIIGHYEAYKRGIGSNHADPAHWFTRFGRSMDTLRDDVAALLAQDACDLSLQSPMLRGGEVQALQSKLAALGYDLGSAGADGIYGKRTDAALRLFQARAAEMTGGVCDAAARRTLNL